MDVKAAQTAVFAKIGRNMVLFQQLEFLLKGILSYSELSGTMSELRTRMQKRVKTTHRKTLGQLVGEYVDDVIGPDAHEGAAEPEVLTEPFISMKCYFGHDEDYFAGKKEQLARLVADRNDLIHDLLPKLDVNSVESCDALGAKLEEQADVVRKEIRSMRVIAKAVLDGRRAVAEFLDERRDEVFLPAQEVGGGGPRPSLDSGPTDK